MTREDETKYWLSVPGILEAIAMSEEDVAADRTYGEAEVRAYLADVSAELSTADANYASRNTVSGEELRQRYGLP